MTGCKTANENFLCPLKFLFNIIKSDPVRFILLALFMTIIASFLIVFILISIFIFKLDFFNFTFIIVFLIASLVTSHFVYIAKLFTKNLDEAIKVFNSVPIYKSFDYFGVAAGIVIGNILFYGLLSLLSFILMYLFNAYILIVLGIILGIYIPFFTPAVLGYALLSNTFIAFAIFTKFLLSFLALIILWFIISFIVYIITVTIIGFSVSSINNKDIEIHVSFESVGYIEEGASRIKKVCKKISDDYMCPIKFIFKLIKTNPIKYFSLISFIFIYSIVTPIFIEKAVIFMEKTINLTDIDNTYLSSGIKILLISLFGVLFIPIISILLYISKILTKEIDEASKAFNDTSIFRHMLDNLKVGMGIYIGLIILILLNTYYLMTLFKNDLIIAIIIVQIFFSYTSPAVLGYTLQSSNFKEGFIRVFNYFNPFFIKSYINIKYLAFVIVMYIIMYIVIYIASIIIVIIEMIITPSDLHIEGLIVIITLLIMFPFFVASVNYKNKNT